MGSLSKLEEFIECLQSQHLIVEEPKCNFDVEIALDMLDATEKVSGVMLFSGDSDFQEPLKRLKLKNKNIYILGVRNQMAKELIEVGGGFINFGHWYQGYKKRKPRS